MSEYIVDFGSLAMLSRVVESESNRLGEPVVRCKDCKYFGYLGDDMCYLPNGDGGFAGWKVDPEGFCAWGER